MHTNEGKIALVMCDIFTVLIVLTELPFQRFARIHCFARINEKVSLNIDSQLCLYTDLCDSVGMVNCGSLLNQRR